VRQLSRGVGPPERVRGPQERVVQPSHEGNGVARDVKVEGLAGCHHEGAEATLSAALPDAWAGSRFTSGMGGPQAGLAAPVIVLFLIVKFSDAELPDMQPACQMHATRRALHADDRGAVAELKLGPGKACPGKRC
jgi:hypothetical protein